MATIIFFKRELEFFYGISIENESLELKNEPSLEGLASASLGQ